MILGYTLIAHLIVIVIFSAEGENMVVSYNKLWKLLIDRKMSAAELRRKADISPNTMTRLRKDQEVTMQVIGKICKVLEVDVGDIMSYELEKEENR